MTNAWRKSSRSGGDGSHCVELARLSGDIGVRDSKDPHGPKLLITPDTFRALMAGLKR
ncbi:DUF397 domain-containing protein [Actinomadura sp. 3N508]|uniref:DUF397 domain-containing protein n=1 Tax=Actinomadura sp. 3N508 TaxID=3375153 RepID=UPI003787873D